VVRSFPDKEVYATIQESVEGEEVFVLSSATASSWMSLFLLLDALVRARPRRVYLCFSYFGYGRQDRPTEPYGCFSVQRLAALLGTFPLERIFIIDLHNRDNVYLFPVPCCCINPSKIFSDYIDSQDLFPDVFIAPDRGAISRVQQLATVCDRPWELVDKRTEPQGYSRRFQGKRCAIVDDLIDSGRTLCHTSRVLRKEGARGVTAFVTHCLFKRMDGRQSPDLGLEGLTVTDTLPLPSGAPLPLFVRQITVASLVEEIFVSLCGKRR
jgi:ribose-phosphate pyrophosphokinase